MIENENMQKGIFVISLDLELIWGVLNNKNLEKYKENIFGEPDAVKGVLKLFNKYSIHATWGIVGFLFFKNKYELIRLMPKYKPKYNQSMISPYDYINTTNFNKTEDKLYFGPSLIKTIKSYANQEIGTHTFSHYCCLEDEENLIAFEDDLRACKKIANRYNIRLKSLIFPKNQLTPKHINICKKAGISAYRGNFSKWPFKQYGRNSSFLIKLLRYADAYSGVLKRDFVALGQIKKHFPYNIPMNRFLYPFNEKLSFLENFKLRIIKKDLKYAAQNGLVYHLWWHPHNFGINGEKNLLFLEKILKYYVQMKQMYGMKSLNMNEITNKLREVD